MLNASRFWSAWLSLPPMGVAALLLTFAHSGIAHAEPLTITANSDFSSFVEQVQAYEASGEQPESSTATLQSIFDALDKDGNGRLDAGELQALNPSGVDSH